MLTLIGLKQTFTATNSIVRWTQIRLRLCHFNARFTFKKQKKDYFYTPDFVRNCSPCRETRAVGELEY